jgi:hypothetical protein
MIIIFVCLLFRYGNSLPANCQQKNKWSFLNPMAAMLFLFLMRNIYKNISKLKVVVPVYTE